MNFEWKVEGRHAGIKSCTGTNKRSIVPACICGICTYTHVLPCLSHTCVRAVNNKWYTTSLAFLLNGQVDIFIPYLQSGNPLWFLPTSSQAPDTPSPHPTKPRLFDGHPRSPPLCLWSRTHCQQNSSLTQAQHTFRTTTQICRRRGVVTPFQAHYRHQLRCAVPHESPLSGV